MIAALLSIPADWIIIGTCTVLASLDIAAYGAKRECALALAFPLAATIFTLAPSTAFVGSTLQQIAFPHAEALVFVVLLIVLFAIIHRLRFADGIESARPLPAALGGVALTIIIIVFWLSIPALASLWMFGGSVQLLFAEQYRLFWLLAAYIALVVVRG